MKQDYREYLYRLLTNRPYTKAEILKRLKGAGCGDSEAESLVYEFSALGLIDDAAYAALFAEGHENWGNERIRFELRRRGIDNPNIAAALESINEQERAHALWQLWSSQLLDWKKIASRLARRGFSQRTITKLERGKEFIEW